MPDAIRAAACIGAALALMPASTLAARIWMKPIGPAATPIYTDGVRWAVYEPAVGLTRILDTRTGRSMARADPPGCAGRLDAIGSGELVYSCAQTECPTGAILIQYSWGSGCVISRQGGDVWDGRWVVEDLRSGVVYPLAGDSELPFYDFEGGGYIALNGIGSQWAEGKTNTLYAGTAFYVNWHTGQVHKGRDTPKSGGTCCLRGVADLNATSLFPPLCAPLEFPFTPQIHEVEDPDVAYADGWGASPAAQAGLRLSRCGTRAVRFLPRRYGEEPFSSIQIGADVLSWIGVGVGTESAWATRLIRQHRDWHATIYRLDGPEPSLVQHTARAVFETGRNGRVYVGRLP